MSIDWFTFTAQILNFLLLAWLLKHFLYGPITNAMEQREARIAAKLADAIEARDAATQLQTDLRTKLRDHSIQREAMLAAAGQEADIWRASELNKSKAEVETARTQWYSSLDREKQTMMRQLQLDVTDHATSLCQHVLSQLADERLQSHIVELFLSQLSDQAGPGSEIRDSLNGQHAVIVESSHKLNQQEHTRITTAIHDIGACQEVTFRVNAQLVCGIEVRAPGCKLAWSIRDSLAELKSKLVDSIDQLVPGNARSVDSHSEKWATR